MTIRNDMFSEIQCRLICHGNQALLQSLPVENINTHGCQIASGVLRLFLKFLNLTVFIGNNNAKPACLFHGNRHNCNRHFRSVCLMEVQHHLVVHLIDVVSGQNQNIFRIVILHICQILINGIRRAGIPFRVSDFLIGR